MYTIGKEFQQRNSFFRSMTIWDFFYFWIAFVTCLFCTWNRSHEKWIWVVDFRLWILIQPCYASRAPNALAQIAFPWEKKHTEFCHMSKWKKESKKKSETPKHWIATKDYLLNEFLMVLFIFCKKNKRMCALFRFIFLIRSSIAIFRSMFKMLRLQCTLQGIHQCENQQAIRVENEKMSNDLLSRRFNAFLADGEIDNS